MRIPVVLVGAVAVIGVSQGAWTTSDLLHWTSSIAGTVSSAASSVATTMDENATPPVGPGPTRYTVQTQPAAGSCHYRATESGQPLPDRTCTPGATNPKVTQATLASTICRSGYTASIRPSSSITRREKAANAKSYGYTKPLADAEYDHLISLELGGDPNDPRNLWVQPPSPGHKPGTGVHNDKDPVENKIKAAICAGTVTLADAQRAIAYDWTTALDRLKLSR